MAGISQVTDDTFEDVVLNAERPVVVDFWAAWCGPCKTAGQALERLADKYEGIVDFVKLDVDANPAISQALQIMNLPTIVLFRADQPPVFVYGGGYSPEQYEAAFGLSQYARPAT
jgi:thioredoxin 1